MGKFNIAKDDGGNSTFVINQADWMDNISIQAGSRYDYAVPHPGSYGVAMFSCVNSSGNDVGFWALFDPASGSGASLPAASTTSGEGSEPNPYLRDISGVNTISLISNRACHVNLALYSKFGS